MKIESKGNHPSATPRQRYFLFRLTGRDWDAVDDLKKYVASQIIDRLLKARQTRNEVDMKRAEDAVRLFFPDWMRDELNTEYIKLGSKPRRGRKTSPQPNPRSTPPTQPSVPDTPNTPTEADPSDPSSKIEELERLLEQVHEKDKPTESPTPDTDTEDTDENPAESGENAEIPGLVWSKQYLAWKKLLDANIPFFVSGPAGCGKTYPLRKIAESLNLEPTVISLSGGVRYSQVFGSTVIRNGETHWEPAPLLKAVQNKGVIILDELPAADPDVLIGVNSLVEPSQRYIQTPAGRIDVHPDCRFCATGNTAGRASSRQYVATQIQDGSILDRFGIKYIVDYDPDVERALIEPMIGESKTRKLLFKVRNLRCACKEREVKFDASTRRLLLAARQIQIGFSVDDAFEHAFLTSLSAAERGMVEG